MRVDIYSGYPIINHRILSSERAIGADKVIPMEVDIRMDPNPCADQNLSQPALTARPLHPNVRDEMKHLSRAPLLFLTFYPDGSVMNSWAYPCNTVTEYREPPTGRHLGVTEIFLQVRGDENAFTARNFQPDYLMINEGIFPNQSLATMYYEDGTPRYIGSGSYETEIKHGAMSDGNGRRIVINNATGRVIIENWAPYNIDVPPLDLDHNGEIDEWEIFRDDDNAYPNRKHWL